jgi:hypothetical protein
VFGKIAVNAVGCPILSSVLLDICMAIDPRMLRPYMICTCLIKGLLTLELEFLYQNIREFNKKMNITLTSSQMGLPGCQKTCYIF